MKKTLMIAGLILFALSSFARRYMVKSGEVSFSVAAPMRMLHATNNQLTGMLDLATGDIFFEVPVAGFLFQNEYQPDQYDSAIGRRFNGFYMSTEHYPTAAYKGRIINPSAINLEQDGTYQVETEGILTIRGTGNPVKLPGTAVVRKGEISITCAFTTNTAAYKIRVPRLVRGTFFHEVDISVSGLLVPEQLQSGYKEKGPAKKGSR
jgi:hypothetical protein